MSHQCHHPAQAETSCPQCGRALFTYLHRHPAIAADIAVFTLLGSPETTGDLAVLLIKRREPPYAQRWALPGGFLRYDEDVDQCARRELAEETGVKAAFLEQLGVFSAPNRDPRQRVVSVPYLAVVAHSETRLAPATDADDAKWVKVSTLKKQAPLAFDHRQILLNALKALRANLRRPDLYVTLLPEAFSLAQIKAVHDAIAERPEDKGNLRKIVRRWEDEGAVHVTDFTRMSEQDVSRPGPKTTVFFTSVTQK